MCEKQYKKLIIQYFEYFIDFVEVKTFSSVVIKLSEHSDFALKNEVGTTFQPAAKCLLVIRIQYSFKYNCGCNPSFVMVGILLLMT